MHEELIRDLIEDLRGYAGVAEEGGAQYCAELMRRAARALEKEEPRVRGNGHGAWAEAHI